MKPTVLIVEDDPDIAECLQYNLDLDNLQTQVAPSVDEGLSALLDPRNMLAVVLLDPHVMDVGAVQVWARLREETRSRNVPLILLTSFTCDNPPIAGLQIEADYYISKPYSMREISSTVEMALTQPVG